MTRKMTVIPPKTSLVTERKKVAAYARVSNGKDAMLHSLSAQVSYYSSYIQKHGDWYFAGVYADEAFTGTKDSRPEFQRMIADCKAGKIDMLLTNEKYKGDTLLQKTFTVDFLPKKKKVNEGEIQQYYLEGSHQAIISPELFDLVQIEFKKRKGQKRSTAGIFASKLICGDCGHFYGNKVWHSNSKYRRIVWQCNSKFRNTEKCKTPHLDEEKLKGIFVELFNSMIEDRKEIIQTLTDIIKDLTDTTKLDAKIQRKAIESKKTAEKIREWVNENAHRAMNQMDYEVEYQKRADIYRKIQESIEAMANEKLLRQNKYKETVVVLNLLKENEKPITEFDEGLFHSLIDNVKVMSDKKLVFCFKDGTEIDRDI